MKLLLSVSLAVIPAILLVIYFYKRDAAKPEPKKLIVRIFLIGMVCIIPALIVELIIQNFGKPLNAYPIAPHLFRAFIVAGLCEEGIKLLVVILFIFHHKDFDEVMDGIVYVIVASLGFACFENILYVIQGGISTAILRAFTAIPLHTIASGIMGYYVGLAKFNRKKSGLLIFNGLLFAILIHGYYNFVLFAIPQFGLIPALTIIPLLLICGIILHILIKKAIGLDKEAMRV